jgi:hypothetical protein
MARSSLKLSGSVQSLILYPGRVLIRDKGKFESVINEQAAHAHLA